MRENEAQKGSTSLTDRKSNSSEEVSEPEEEPDQPRQDRHMQCLMRNVKIKLVTVGLALSVIILCGILFIFTTAILPLFITIVGVPLFYRAICVYLDKSEAMQ
jgi:hypothetical protein